MRPAGSPAGERQEGEGLRGGRRVATPAWPAQEGAIELTRGPHARRPRPPNLRAHRIDPGTKTTFEEILVSARLSRPRSGMGDRPAKGESASAGSRSGCRSRPPTPSSRPATGSSSCRGRWARCPELVSWEWSKRDRTGRARLDFTQNAINRTLVAAYSARPSTGAPVSTPITWDELDDPDLAPDRWTISSLPERIAAVGDLFAPALSEAQKLPPL